MANAYFPRELIENILSRLSLKPLFRFKYVSKLWFSIINSPLFFKLHLQQTLISDKKPRILLDLDCLLCSPIPDEKDPVLRFTEVNFPREELCKNRKREVFDFELSPEILGVCNGIACVAFFDRARGFFFNPSMDLFREISCFKPSPPSKPFTAFCNRYHFGFGYDAVSDEYKLVRLTETFRSRDLVNREASVYMMRANSWKCADDISESVGFIIHRHMGVLSNEHLHFLLKKGKERQFKCFNVRTETFSLMNLPQFDKNFQYEHYLMRDLRGCFCVVVNHLNSDFGFEKADLWVMKDYGNENSWFRLFTIQGKDVLEVSCVSPVINSKNQKRVLLQWNTSWGWYDWAENRLERVEAAGLPSCVSAYLDSGAWIVVESLDSLGKDEDDKSKTNIVPKKQQKQSRSTATDDFLSSEFKLKL